MKTEHKLLGMMLMLALICWWCITLERRPKVVGITVITNDTRAISAADTAYAAEMIEAYNRPITNYEERLNITNCNVLQGPNGGITIEPRHKTNASIPIMDGDSRSVTIK